MRITRERLNILSYDRMFSEPISIDGDYSLSALLRAIVLNKDNEEDIIAKTKIVFERASVEGYINGAFASDAYVLGIFEVNSFDNLTYDVSGWKTFDGASSPLNAYMSQFTKTKLYVNEEKKRIIAIAERRITSNWAQALCSILFKLMTWYFGETLSPEDKAFARSIAYDTKDITLEQKEQTLIDYCDKAVEAKDLKTIALKTMLKGVGDYARKSRITDLQSQEKSTESDIRAYSQSLRDRYQRLEGIKVELKGLLSQDDNSDDQIIEFFMTHKNMTVLDVKGSEIVYGVVDTLEFYDENEFKRDIENPRSFWKEFSDDNKKYIKKLLVERKGVCKVKALFSISNMRYVQSYKITDRTFFYNRLGNILPNPHIGYHACDGQNGEYYTQYANSGDWEMALEQSIGATKNINPGDSTVVKEFVRDLTGGYIKVPCIYVNKDGSAVDTITENSELIAFEEFKKRVDEGVL